MDLTSTSERASATQDGGATRASGTRLTLGPVSEHLGDRPRDWCRQTPGPDQDQSETTAAPGPTLGPGPYKTPELAPNRLPGPSPEPVQRQTVGSARSTPGPRPSRLGTRQRPNAAPGQTRDPGQATPGASPTTAARDRARDRPKGSQIDPKAETRQTPGPIRLPGRTRDRSKGRPRSKSETGTKQRGHAPDWAPLKK